MHKLKKKLFSGRRYCQFKFNLRRRRVFSSISCSEIAFFIKDNVALGAYVNFGLATSKGAKTSTTYGAGALGRYYINDPKTNVLKHGCLFLEGNVGMQGQSAANGVNTTGLGIGLDPVMLILSPRKLDWKHCSNTTE